MANGLGYREALDSIKVASPNINISWAKNIAPHGYPHDPCDKDSNIGVGRMEQQILACWTVGTNW